MTRLTFLRPALALVASALLATGFVAAAVAPAYAATPNAAPIAAIQTV